MLIQYMQLGSYGTNCYLLSDKDTKEVAVIDPGYTPDVVLKAINDSGLTVKYILLTHGHFDHTGGVAGLYKATGAPIYIHKAEMDLEKDDPVFAGLSDDVPLNYYDEGDVLSMGKLNIEVMHTPGHSPGSVVLKVEQVLFCGDTLFAGSCGRTDFNGGDYDKMMQSLRRLYELEGNYDVLPGHENHSTLDRERKYNPYMRQVVAK